MKRILITILSISLIISLMLAMSACSTPAAETSASESVQASQSTEAAASESASSAPAEKYKIALSNSYMGNDWRQEMVKVLGVVCTKPPYADSVDLKVVNTDNTPEAQSASIDDLIQQGYDAILIDASSPSALNPAVNRALEAGIVVVSFDQILDNDQTYNIETDWDKTAAAWANFVAKAIDGKGNIVFDRGMPGAPLSTHVNEIAKGIFAQYPDIKIVAEFDGQYTEGLIQQGMATALAANPDIDAVFSQGYLTPLLNAFDAAGRDYVPMNVFITNGGVLDMIDHDVNVLAGLNSAGLSALALKTAVDILNGQVPAEHHILYEPYFVANDTSIDLGVGIPSVKPEEGVNCFRDLPGSFFWPALPDDFGVTITPEEVMG